MTRASHSNGVIIFGIVTLLLFSLGTYRILSNKYPAVDSRISEERLGAHQEDLAKLDTYYSELRKIEDLEKKGDYEAAVAGYNKLIEKYQGAQAEVSLKWFLMRLYVKNDRLKEGIDLLDWRIDLEKKKLRRQETLEDFSQQRRALVSEYAKDYASAIAVYESRLAKKTKSKTSTANETIVEGSDRKELIRLYEKAGEFKKALEQINWFLRYRGYDELTSVRERLSAKYAKGDMHMQTEGASDLPPINKAS